VMVAATSGNSATWKRMGCGSPGAASTGNAVSHFSQRRGRWSIT
jgi:hypothetical protein